MRNEQEMYDLILSVAKADERVLAVYMNGSRTNPNVKKDKYRDYDIVFVVAETQSFINDRSWISVFGDFAIVQEPDFNDFGWGLNHDFTRSYTWLMLFTDGNRIDLGIKVLDCALEDYLSDTLCIKLLDKDNILPDISESNDSLYHIKQPTKQQYDGCCNEFWWCLNNVAKGIARDQMPYAQRMYMQIVHIELEKMVEWYIAIQHDFLVSTGMWGKYFKKYLSPDLYEQYAKTYSDSNYENLWTAIFTACNLFRNIAKQVAMHLKCTYNQRDDDGIMGYLEKMRNYTL
jgi:aminoglycoside 6-adenylyltransferase